MHRPPPWALASFAGGELFLASLRGCPFALFFIQVSSLTEGTLSLLITCGSTPGLSMTRLSMPQWGIRASGVAVLDGSGVRSWN